MAGIQLPFRSGRLNPSESMFRISIMRRWFVSCSLGTLPGLPLLGFARSGDDPTAAAPQLTEYGAHVGTD